MAKKMKTYTVWGKVTIDTTVSIEAESLADAVERSKELKETDFVKILGEYNDGALRITGVMDRDY